MHYFFTKTRLYTFAISSLALFLFSIILSFVIIPVVINSQIDKNIRLERGTDQWHRFVQIPFNLTFNATFFHVTNAENVTQGAFPNVEERGPYSFDKMVRRDVSFYNENNLTTSYDRDFEYYFNPTLSGPGVSYDDNITIINPAYIAVTQAITSFPKSIIKAVMNCINTMFAEKIVLKDFPVKKLIFDGFSVCNYTNPKCRYLKLNLCAIFLKLQPSKLIELVEDENGDKYVKFSYFNYRRKAPDGIYEVNTGMSDISQIGSISNWDYSNYTDVWGKNKSSCNFISGTDGTLFRPHLSEDSVLSVYSTDLCRSVNLYYNDTGTYHGIEGFVYKTKPTLFNSESTSDKCFCGTTKNVNEEKDCFMDGVMDISPCLGSAVLASYPHFLYGENYLGNLTGDLSPDPTKHEIFGLLDKYTGIPLMAHQRVQLNIILRPEEKVPDTKLLPRTILPLVWIDEGINLPSSGLDLLNSLFYDTLNLVKILKWMFMGVSLTLTILSFILIYCHLYSP